MLIISDEKLIQRLQQIAERENRPVEEVIRSMLAQYPAAKMPLQEPAEDAARAARRKIYASARRHWQAAGETARASMTDEALDELFGGFDEEGIPRLKSEMPAGPPPGSLAYAAHVAGRGRLRSGRPDLARRSREILQEHLANDLLKRIKGEDASE